MAVIVHVRALWTGFSGAPGYTNWYGLSDGDAAAAANALGPRMRTFFNAIANNFPNTVSIKVDRTYQVIANHQNGAITSEATLTADPAVVDGTSAQPYSAASGVCVNWLTGNFNAAGHRVVGRTYLVPITSTAYENDGSIAASNLAAIQAAASAAVGGTGALFVYHRPSSFAAADGSGFLATAAQVRDKVAVLRSRRD